MQRVELEELDAGVKVARGVGAVAGYGGRGAAVVGCGGAIAAWGGRVSGEAVGDVEVGGAGSGEVVFEALLVEGLGFGVREEERGSVVGGQSECLGMKRGRGVSRRTS